MTKIFRGLLAIWALILFVITLIIIMFPVAFSLLWKEPKRGTIVYNLYKVWMWFYFPLVGIKREIKGLEHFKPNQGYVITPNHRSFLDIMVTVPAFPAPSKTLAKKEMANIPIFGIIYRAASVLVDRSNEESRRESLLRMQAVLEMGQYLCLYPEGTRNKTDLPLQDFYKGAFKTAIQTQQPIIPCVLFNTGEIMPPNKLLYLKPGTVHIHFLPPIDVSSNSDVKALRDLVHQQMWDYIEQNKNKLA